MVKKIFFVGIEALNWFLCMYLAYALLKEKEEELDLKQKIIRILEWAGVSIFNSMNLPILYYNNGVWIQMDLLLMLVFKFRKGRHNFMRCGIAILVKHLIVYMDYAIGFLFIGVKGYSMETILYNEKIESVIAFFVVRVLLLIAILILQPRIKGRFSDLRQTRRVLFIVDIISYIGVLLFQQLFMREIQHIYVNIFYVTLAMGTILCTVFYSYDSMVSRRERELLVDITNKLVEDNYQRLYNEQKRLEHTAHDIKNHIFLLTKYLEDGKIDEAIEYGKKLTNPLEVLVQRSWSGNKILDTILNTKLLEAERKNIQVHMEIDHMLELPLADYDLCVIVSNLFDNAIEACEYVKKEEKEIFVSIKSTDILYVIRLVNSMEKKPVKKNHKYYTIKGNQDIHGIGLESVRASVEKYQGTLLLEHTENQFSAVVSIMEQSKMK
ncbi:GHKL domain-containing protein [Schaedlerella arabinosiphila]|uniref:GHKL domain-containing protein n=1 Tax=Schaedlerella arabinosiphila TaxID=2044587 RepID=A0A9X5H5K8_9FIRM|nr:sensor histidine kinase [Schaedlerella arabinosiphila]NDO70102.1 GHKL domain-containing protein [Schaedlerella arabinosiphila]